MTDQVVTLRIVGENGKLVAAVKASKSELDSLGRSATSSGQQGSAGLDKIGESAQRNKRDLDAMGGSVRGLSGMIAGLGLAAIGKRIGGAFIEAADRAGQLEARIRNATTTQAEFNYVLERSGQIGRASYQSINTIGEIAINAAGPMKQLGFSIRDTLDLTEAMSLSLVASAANQQRSAATVDQFSKALQLGVLRGEAFNTVLSNAPEFVSALERSLGKTRAEIIAMANAGQLTVGELTKVASELDTLNQKVEAMPTTVEDAWVRFRDVFQNLAGEINKTSTATGTIVTMIGGMSAALGPLAAVAGVVAVAIGGRLVAALGAYLISKVIAIRVEAQHAVAMQYGTVAALAKARAMQGLNVAMAAFGGPVGLAVTALTLFVLWARNSAAEARRLSEEVKEGFQGAMQTFESFNRATANESFAGLKASFEHLGKAKDEIALLEKQERELNDRRLRWAAQYGSANDDLIGKLADKRRELEFARLAYDQMGSAADRTVAQHTDLILELSGVTSATDAQRVAVEKSVRELVDQKKSMEQLKAPMAVVIENTFGLEHANNLLGASFRNLKADIDATDWSDIDKSLDQQLTQSRLRLIEQTQGKAVAMRTGFALQLGKDGVDVTSPEALQRRAVNEEVIENTLAYEANAEAARKAGAAGKEYLRDGEARNRELKQQADSQARWTQELERTAAAFEGPLKVAEVERKHRLAALDVELKANTISQVGHTEAKRQAELQYQATTAEIEREQNVMARVQDDYRDAIALQGLSSEAKRVELELRQRINDAKRAGSELAPGEIADLRQVITENERYLTVMELQAAAAENYERMWDGAISSVADAFGGWVIKAGDQYKSFGKSLKDITKRFLADIVSQFTNDSLLTPLKQWFRQLTSGGFASAGGSGGAGGGFGGVIGALFGGGGGNGMGGWAGNVGSAMRAWMGGSAGGTAASAAGMGGAFGWTPEAANLYTKAGGALTGGGAIGGAGGGGLQVSPGMGMLTGEFAGGMPYASAGLGLYGLYYGATQRGNGGLSSGMAGLSYGAAGVAAGGAIAGGLGALGTAAGVGGMGAGAAAGATTAMGALGGAAWIPVVGWILAAAAVVDMISGGKLFGTKYALDSSASTIDFDAAGITGVQELHESRQKALFGGKKRRTTTQAFDAETQGVLADVFKQMNQGIAQAARQVGVETPGMVAASFRQEFDKKGNLKKEFGTIAGRVYEEAQEVFFERLAAENLLNVAMQVGNRGEIDQLANRYRDTPETLDEFAQFMIAVQGDINNAKALWTSTGPGMLTSIVATMDRLASGTETLLQTYQRINQVALEYGSFIAGIDTQLRTADLNDYQKAQLDIELGYRGQVKQANELAKALGLSGARSEDLAKIEALRAHNMAALQKQQEAQKNTFLEDLGLGNLSTLRDDQKLVESMQLLRDAVGAGDMQRAQQMAQQSLGLGRNLYASGRDYSDLYSQVTGLIDGMTPATMEGFNDEQLDNIASLIEGLPQGIATAMFQLVVVPPPAPITPWTPPTPVNPTGGGSASNDQLLRELQQMNARLDAIANNTGGQLAQARSDSQDVRNNGYLVQAR